MRQIGLATAGFQSARGHFPAGVSGHETAPYPLMSWLTRVLPFTEETAVWNQAVSDYRNSRSPYHGGHAGWATAIPVFQCPSDSTAKGVGWSADNRLVAVTSYLGVNGTNYHRRDGLLYLDSMCRPADVADGLSQTMLAGERPPSENRLFGPWYAIHNPDRQGSTQVLLGVAETNDGSFSGIFANLKSCPRGPHAFGPPAAGDLCAVLHFWSRHDGGALFAMADASVHFRRYDIGPEVMNALATRSGGETIE